MKSIFPFVAYLASVSWVFEEILVWVFEAVLPQDDFETAHPNIWFLKLYV